MPEDTEFEETEQEQEENPRDLRAQLKAEKKRAEQLEAKVRKSELMQTLRDSDVKLTGPIRFALNSYDGEPEAVKSFLEENGFLEGMSAQTPDVPREEVEAHSQISDAAAGATPQTPPGEDAHIQELEELGKTWLPGMDTRPLMDKGIEIMQRHGQRISIESPGEQPD